MNTKVVFASAALAAPFIITGVAFIFMALRVRSWPCVPGKILEAKAFWVFGAHGTCKFKARYLYSVHGHIFEGTPVTVADWFLYSWGDCCSQI
jgi:hypothetical protein